MVDTSWVSNVAWPWLRLNGILLLVIAAIIVLIIIGEIKKRRQTKEQVEAELRKAAQVTFVGDSKETAFINARNTDPVEFLTVKLSLEKEGYKADNVMNDFSKFDYIFFMRK
jgi:hypothetical protein